MSPLLRATTSLFMCLLISNLPAAAATDAKMISTSEVVEELSRAEAQHKVEEFLSDQQVRESLRNKGVSAEEISSRLASLSESELRQLAKQVDEARYGGLLVEILIVVLIIFLIRKM